MLDDFLNSFAAHHKFLTHLLEWLSLIEKQLVQKGVGFRLFKNRNPGIQGVLEVKLQLNAFFSWLKQEVRKQLLKLKKVFLQFFYWKIQLLSQDGQNSIQSWRLVNSSNKNSKSCSVLDSKIFIINLPIYLYIYIKRKA